MTLLEHKRMRARQAKNKTITITIPADCNLAQTLQAIDDCRHGRNMTEVDCSSYEAFVASLGL